MLTSGKTFSGGDEFSYNLQQLKRATLVGSQRVQILRARLAELDASGPAKP